MNIDDIPWSRIVHFYGRATEIPDAIRDLASERHGEAEKMLARNLEHQDGVIQATPLAVHFIAAALREGRVRDRESVERILGKVLAGAEFQLESNGAESGSARALEDVYAAEQLWPEFEDDDTDEELWEEWSQSDEDSRAWAALTVAEIRASGIAMDAPPSSVATRTPQPKAKPWWRFW